MKLIEIVSCEEFRQINLNREPNKNHPKQSKPILDLLEEECESLSAEENQKIAKCLK